MASLGAFAELVNSSELTLEVGSDIYVALTNLQLHIGRTEDRIPTTDLGALYAYGKGDNFFTATLQVTTPELGDGAGSLNALTKIDANGDMISTLWKIVAKDLSGATKTFAATGILKEYDVKKGASGYVEIDIFVRITGDTITIT